MCLTQLPTRTQAKTMTEQHDDAAKNNLESPGQGENQLERLAARLMRDLSDDDTAPNGDHLNHIMLSEKYRGPFSHPYILKELEQVVDNGAERAFRLTEKEQDFRHEQVKELLGSEIKEREKAAFDRRLVIILVFSFLILCLAGAFAAVMTGHDTGAGLVAGAGAVVTGAALLITRPQKNKSEE
jgi:uncharacterized membrane protein